MEKMPDFLVLWWWWKVETALSFPSPLSALKFQSQIEFIIISIDIDNEPKTTQDKLSCLIILTTTLFASALPTHKFIFSVLECNICMDLVKYV
jgi:hypothetical protein